MKPVSTAQELFACVASPKQAEPYNPNTVTKGPGNRENTSKVNFSLGSAVNPKFYNETSTGAIHTQQPQSSRAVVEQNMRAANFVVGTEKLDYTTTTQTIQNEANKQEGEKISVTQMK